MTNALTTKSFLITGGTTGIGFATAQLLTNEGARVLITGTDRDRVDAAVTALGANTQGICSDSGSAADAKSLGVFVEKSLGKLDGVFINAAACHFGPVESLSEDQVSRMFAVNAAGPIFQIRALLPLLKSSSAVVLNASIAGQVSFGGSSAYAASKAALAAVGRTLAVELAPRNIRVNTISPGPIATPLIEKLIPDPTARADFGVSVGAATLLGRQGTAEEIARLVRFLLSSDSSFIVGAEIVIDGGIRLRTPAFGA